jgi:hypothetical protein
MAARLVETHRNNRDRGVRFISLTADPEDVALRFVRQHGITWPTRFGSRGLLALLGALPRQGGMPDFATPLLYVVGSDGRVRWSSLGRYRHRDLDELLAELQAEIELALEESRTSAAGD